MEAKTAPLLAQSQNLYNNLFFYLEFQLMTSASNKYFYNNFENIDMESLYQLV